jgi:hypothetical protein
MSAHHIGSYRAVIPEVRQARRSTMSAGRYEIRLKGHLGPRWAARFDGMTLTTRPDGTTLIAGPVVDQAALHGLLRMLHDLGLPLLSVAQVEPDHSSEPTSEPR